MSQSDLYRQLPQALRDLDSDQGKMLLQRFLLGPQQERDRIEAAILTLPDQIIPAKARDDAVQFLKDIVGLTSDLQNITNRLTTQQLRRLIQLAVPLWQQRLTERGIINMIRLLTGRMAVYTSWFGFRFLIGEACLSYDENKFGGDPWIIGGAGGVYDEYWSHLKLSDDGSLDRQMLLDILQLGRPLNERIEVLITDFLDTFQSTLSQWTIVSGAPTINDPAGPKPFWCTLHVGDTMDPKMFSAYDSPPTFGDQTIALKFNITTGVFWIRFAGDFNAGTYYELLIRLTSPHLILSRYNTNTQTLITTFNPTSLSLVANTDYALRIELTRNVVTGNNWIKILIDQNIMISLEDSTTDPTGGGFRIATASGTQQFTNVEAYRLPGRWAQIVLGDTTSPGGVIVRSDNFFT